MTVAFRPLKTSGDRVTWVNRVADYIMDSAEPPPQERLYMSVPFGILTGVNDGHVTAGEVLGEKHRNDFQAGWRIIIDEMVEVLREQGFVGGDATSLRWLKPLNGEWKVQLEKRSVTIWGQKERRIARDNHILGVSTEETGQKKDGWQGLMKTGNANAFEVEVLAPRGGKPHWEKYEVHPYALLVPPMTLIERESFRQDVAENGVKVPLVLYPDAKDINPRSGKPRLKVLDGRHRLYFASQLRKPVHVEVFEGNEEEAKKQVISLNFKRRHLTVSQQHALAIEMFGEEAREEAKKAQTRKPIADSAGQDPDEQNSSSNAGKTSSRIAKKATEAGLPSVTRAGVENMMAVMDAPKTLEAVKEGKLGKVADAVNAASEELGETPKPRGQRGSRPQTHFERLGRVRAELVVIKTDLSLSPGGKAPDDIFVRINELKTMLEEIRIGLKAVIK